MVMRGARYARKERDYYATPAETTEAMLQQWVFTRDVIDPCRGDDAIVDVLKRHGYAAGGFDLDDGFDFLDPESPPYLLHGCYDIVTNPPYGPGGRLALAFIERALAVTAPWQGKVAMLLPADFDSAKTRAHVFGQAKAFAAKLVLLNRVRWFGGKSGSVNHAWYLWSHRRWRAAPVLEYALQEYPKGTSRAATAGQEDTVAA